MLGMKSADGARFPLEAARRLGSDGLREALGLLAQAELDLRGQSGLDERTAIDVLVARLAALSRRHARGSTARAGVTRVASGPSDRAERASVGGGACARALHQARRAASGLVLVDDSRTRGLVEPLLRGLHELLGVVGAGLDRGRGDLHPRLELGAHSLVASRRRSFCRLRFFCDLMFAMCPFLGLWNRGRLAGGPVPGEIARQPRQ